MKREEFDVDITRSGLRGKRLGCVCKPKACHGDVLVELIEGPDPEPAQRSLL